MLIVEFIPHPVGKKSIFVLIVDPKENRMVKTLIVSSALLLGLAGPVSAQKGKQRNSKASKSEVKFLNEIEVDMTPSSVEERSKLSDFETQYFAKKEITSTAPVSDNALVESATRMQLKYALLLDTEVEQIQNTSFYSNIDQWLGTRYRLGGSTKEGIDCSALVQVIFATQYGINLPRTAREQYDITMHISRHDLREGDLVFFNTNGGVSHVGIYLQNNKFLQAGSSTGVTISDLFDPYWEKRFIGVGRYEKQPELITYAVKP